MTNLVTISKSNQPVTTSLKIAEVFSKEHKSVIRAINNIIGGLRNLEDEGRFNFEPVNGHKIVPVNFYLDSYTDSKNEKRKQYIVTRDGFTLLAMGFTGAKALQFKLAYINAFNEMEKKLEAKKALPLDMNAIGGMVKKCCAVAVRQELNAILAGDPKADWEVTDKDLIYQLYRWHATKAKADTEEFRRLYAENEELKKKIAAIKKAVR